MGGGLIASLSKRLHWNSSSSSPSAEFLVDKELGGMPDLEANETQNHDHARCSDNVNGDLLLIKAPPHTCYWPTLY